MPVKTEPKAPPKVAPAPQPRPEREMEPERICPSQKEEVVRRIRRE